MDAIVKLRKKIADESLQERSHICQTHRYYSCTHNMKIISQRHTGQYLISPERQELVEIAAKAESLLTTADLQTEK